MKKKVTLSIESKVYDEFQKICDEKAIMLSRKIEIWIENFIKEEKDRK